MDLVLGLSMTSSSARWVLVEGTAGDGATVDRGSLPADAVHTFEAEAVVKALFDKTGGRRVHAIGLTWTGGAEASVSAVWQALADRQVENIIAISDLEAAEALTAGIADIAGYQRVVVCVVEPGAAVLAAVTPDGVTADRVDVDDLDELDGFSADSVFVVGSGDVGAVVAAVKQRTSVPVISADDADLALAKGSALAAASAVALLDAQTTPERSHLSATAMLGSVLAAAMVTFVVSLSVALGMTLVPVDEPTRIARSDATVSETSPDTAPSPARAAPRPPKSPVPWTTEAPAAAEPVAVAVPVPDAALIVEQPAAEAPPLPEFLEPQVAEQAFIPPAPAYVPPAPPPNYLPPAAAPGYVAPGGPPVAPVPPPGVSAAQIPTASSQQQPRLRDRIIERIPIINRFHEPDPYGQ